MIRHGKWLWRDHPADSRFTPYGLWELTPNSSSSYLATDVNGFVHNGYNRPILEDRDRFLIFVLGGSTVHGLGASDNASTFAAQLEKIIDKSRPGCCRVVNAGISNSMSYQQLGMLEGRLTQEFEPDMVIALDGRNDATFAASYKAWTPNWSPAYDKIREDVNRMMSPPLSAGLLYWLPLRSSIVHYLGWFVFRPWIDRARRKTTISSIRSAPAPAPLIERAVESYLVNHEVAHLRLARRKIPYFVFLQPTLLPSLRPSARPDEQGYMSVFFEDFHISEETFYGGIESFYSRAAARGSRLGWFVDLSRVFEREPRKTYVDSCHYNDLANHELARRVAGFLRGRTDFKPRRRRS